MKAHDETEAGRLFLGTPRFNLSICVWNTRARVLWVVTITSMKSFSPSVADATISGGPWIKRRTLISLLASGSAACRGLSHQGTLSGSLLPMDPSPNTSVHDGIACRPPSTVKK
jgi:hypothetical protein